MSDAKKPKAKPLSLYPMSFDEAVRRAIEAGPYLTGKEFNSYKGRKKASPGSPSTSQRRTTRRGPKSAKRAGGTAQRP